MSQPTVVRDEHGQIFVDSSLLELKLDTNRILYAKKKYMNDDNFVSVQQKLPTGLNHAQKKAWMFEFHQMLEGRVREAIVNGDIKSKDKIEPNPEDDQETSSGDDNEHRGDSSVSQIQR